MTLINEYSLARMVKNLTFAYSLLALSELLLNGSSVLDGSPDSVISNELCSAADGNAWLDTSTSISRVPTSPFSPMVHEYTNFPSESVIQLNSF